MLSSVYCHTKYIISYIMFIIAETRINCEPTKKAIRSHPTSEIKHYECLLPVKSKYLHVVNNIMSSVVLITKWEWLLYEFDFHESSIY